jgi:hypothetical protein
VPQHPVVLWTPDPVIQEPKDKATAEEATDEEDEEEIARRGRHGKRFDARDGRAGDGAGWDHS